MQYDHGDINDRDIEIAAIPLLSHFDCYQCILSFTLSLFYLYHSTYCNIDRLEDFDNSCAAYDKAVELAPEDTLTHLNYTITLFSNDELERARKQYAKFETLYHRLVDEGGEIDPDIRIQGDLVQKALKGSR